MILAKRGGGESKAVACERRQRSMAKIRPSERFVFLPDGTLGAEGMRLLGGFSSEFQCIFCKEDADRLPPFKDDEQKRREISRKDAKSLSCPQPLEFYVL